MPRFVIQEHERQAEETHWDLMWEHGPGLKTFRLDRPPQEILHSPAAATPIFDHDKRFLTYQGPVNQSRGRVRIQDAGTVEIISARQAQWVMTFAGRILKGQFCLRQAENNTWEFAYCE